MERMISIKRICDKYSLYCSEATIRKMIYAMNFETVKIKDRKYIQLSDYIKLKYYIKKNKIFDKAKKVEAECQISEAERTERKKKFIELYGPKVEKWFNQNWWPTYEEITPLIFMGLDDDEEEKIV